MKLVLIGIQGAGKSTQGNMLSEEFKIPYVSSGHIFRTMAQEKTKLAAELRETLNSGKLVSDEQTLKIMQEYLSRPEYHEGYILDGFPRTLAQAQAFVEGVDKAIFVEVSDKEALWRISGRVSDRQDETLHAIRKRIELFHDMTEPVIDFYRDRGILVQVNGEKSVEEVFAEITKWLR